LQRTRFAWTSDIDIPPVDGYNVVLTIDGRVQKIVEEELAEGVRRARGEAGLALVLDTADGDVLAMASYPAYDPNHFNHYLPEEFRERRKNRVVENLYEPGSTIKPIWAAAALESGLFKPEQLVWGGGKTTTVLGRPVSDVSDHGAMTFADAIVYSSNVGMVLVGLKLGKERLDEALSRFHFQARTGIPLPGEESGWRMPLARWKDSTTTISASMGFAFNLTPIQLGAAYVSLVNGGRYFTPRLIDRIESKTRVHRFPVIDKGRTVGESTSSRLRDILHRAVEEGTGKQARVPGLPFGGKTGTAPISKGRRGYAAGGAKEYLSSFVAFAPYPDPEIVLLVMVEKPKGAYYGSTVCGPIVRETLKRIFGIDSEVAKN
jgi:cell division protein FtsI (penicillin-binding protein 3)